VGTYAHVSAPLHQVTYLYVCILIEDRLTLAISLALMLATPVAPSIVMVELCVFEETSTVYAIVLHIWLLTGFD
tara:strand:- start:1359 stop:1580 length:222 start_codon:yes stop_codon:yes gene_type:complete